MGCWLSLRFRQSRVPVVCMIKSYDYQWLLLAALSMLFTISVTPQSWSIGPGVIYGDDIEQVGLHVRGYYNLSGDRICFGPEFSHFFSKSEYHPGEIINRYLNEINFNMHYIFELGHQWGVYPLAGINLSLEKEEISFQNGGVVNIHDSAFGANLGIGIHGAVNKWTFFAEFDHLISDLGQNSLVLGTFYTFSKATEASTE